MMKARTLNASIRAFVVSFFLAGVATAAELTGVIEASGYPPGASIEDKTPQLDISGRKFDLLDGRTYRYNLHRTGVHATNPLRSFTGVKWSVKLAAPSHSSPIVADGLLFIVSDDGALSALSAEDGSEKWKYQMIAKKGPIFATPTIAAGCVYVNDPAGNVYVLDSKTGTEKWRRRVCNGSADSVTPAYGVLFITDTKGLVHGIDPSSGEEVWRARRGERGLYNARGTLAPVVKDHLYISFCDYDGYFCVDIPSGAFLWRGDAEMNGKTSSPGAVSGDFIYKTIYTAGGVDRINIVPTAMEKMNNSWWFVKAFDGQKRMGGGGVSGYEMTGACAAKGDFAYAACSNEKLYAFNMSEKKIAWTADLGEPLESSVTMAGDVLYCGGMKGGVFAVDENGKILSKTKVGGAVSCSPWIDDGILYIVDRQEHVHALK